MICPPTIIDLGNDTDARAWLEAIAFSPCLNVAEYAGRRLPDADGLVALSVPFHSTANSAGRR